jgi:hypothetical protein
MKQAAISGFWLSLVSDPENGGDMLFWNVV